MNKFWLDVIIGKLNKAYSYNLFADTDCSGTINGSDYESCCQFFDYESNCCYYDALDDCNICAGGFTGHVANSDMDCSGECFGEAFVDECGMCGGGSYQAACANGTCDYMDCALQCHDFGSPTAMFIACYQDADGDKVGLYWQ